MNSPPRYSLHSRRWRIILSILVLVNVTAIAAAGFTGCDANSTQATTNPRTDYSIGIAFARDGLGDRSWNDEFNDALVRYARQGKLDFELRNFDTEDQVSNVESLVHHRHDIVIGLGPENANPIKALAKRYPEQQFGIIDSAVDSAVDAPNITAFSFNDWDSDFLVGMLSGMLTSTNVVSFLGGAKTTGLARIEAAWKVGVRCANPDAQIHVDYVTGRHGSRGFTDLEAGRRLARKAVEKDVDIVYLAAGRTALGAIDYLESVPSKAITTSRDQRHLAPETIVTSRIRNFDVVADRLIDLLSTNSLGGIVEFNYATRGVELAPLDGSGLGTSTRLVPKSVQEKFDAISSAVLANQIDPRLDAAPGVCEKW